MADGMESECVIRGCIMGKYSARMRRFGGENQVVAARVAGSDPAGWRRDVPEAPALAGTKQAH